ncbi:transglycosylase domain-containing protein [Staphylococcus arlettae]|uniref:Monofunctional glycosyltransferase n=1 Tax=Staphylococcus arlettae TaxID=29378 RepID=A0A380CEQ3_9STAP|nr:MULTISPECIES: biosynthetic peptidoglycan transglycosylase [Staphylococcus]ERF47900.1 transglycosylase [Staphylococcus sp. EGD-HP3]MCD8816711.1 transglycosylase domain-containing protein [Staphylococcus arlettae]MCD8838388.1 transglycosylase domain-containing protein [Staphylococcus arlettae]MCD8840329.1 transglycosylase domain-containing protein [Staphylococcus arlettae]MCD8848662.1 transglycosylase domain-containing protein [Staphylococcus arlettae]
MKQSHTDHKVNTHNDHVHKMEQFEKLYKKLKYLFIGTFIIMASISIILLAASVIYFDHITKEASHMTDHELKTQLLDFPGSEALDFKNDSVLAAYNNTTNTLIVGPAHVNENVIKALTSSEDSLYFKHNGILPKALLRAVGQDIFNTEISSGGSTITQQLVKNQILSNQKTYNRKANELVLAMRTEQLLSKQEILYTYLNIVPFGRDSHGANITGIASASFSLFGKSSNNLTVAESAYIVGLLQSPYLYTPYQENGQLKSNDELQIGLDRQHYVLKRMLVEDKISKATFNKAEQENLKQKLQSSE